MEHENRTSILFVCTANACRSQMAEALLTHHDSQRFEAFSAGVQPAGFVHQLAIDSMVHLGVAMPFADSDDISAYKDQRLDAIITLSDPAAAGVESATWTNDPMIIHWPIPDPVDHPGNVQERIDFACTIARRIQSKINALIALDWQQDRDSLIAALTRLGEI